MGIVQAILVVGFYVGGIWQDSYLPAPVKGPYSNLYLVDGYICLVGPNRMLTNRVEQWCRDNGATDIVMVHE